MSSCQCLSTFAEGTMCTGPGAAAEAPEGAPVPCQLSQCPVECPPEGVPLSLGIMGAGPRRRLCGALPLARRSLRTFLTRVGSWASLPFGAADEGAAFETLAKVALTLRSMDLALNLAKYSLAQWPCPAAGAAWASEWAPELGACKGGVLDHLLTGAPEKDAEGRLCSDCCFKYAICR